MRKPLFVPQNRLDDLMRDHSLSQRQLAEMVGVSQRSVSDWINGVTPLPMYAAIVYAEKFGCSIDFLVGKTDENRKLKDNGAYNKYYKHIKG